MCLSDMVLHTLLFLMALFVMDCRVCAMFLMVPECATDATWALELKRAHLCICESVHRKEHVLSCINAQN
jgi:hypothetical protein